MSFFDRLKKTLSTKIRNKATIDTLMFLFIWITLTSLLSVNYFPFKPLSISDVAPFDIAAPRSIEKEDKAGTEEAKMKAAKEVNTVYSIDTTINAKVLKSIEDSFAGIAEIQKVIKGDLQDGRDEAVLEIRQKIPIPMAEKTYTTLMNADPEFLENNMKLTVMNIIRGEMEKGIKDETLMISIKKAREKASALRIPSDYIAAISDMLGNAMKPNIIVDWNATIREQQRRIAEVKPITFEIPKGQIIIRKGELVTPKQIEILEEMGIYRPNIDIEGLAGAAILVVIVILIVLQYLKQHQPKIFQDDRLLFLLSIIVVAVAVISRWSTKISGFLTPIATASILVTMLMDYRLALFITAFLSILISIFTGNIAPGAVALITGTVAVLSVSKVTRRWDLITATLIVVVTNILSAGVFSLINKESLKMISINSFIWGGLNGTFSCLVAIGAMLFIENLFSITTNIKLLELSNPAEPLLQRLLIEAPGTYHHSIIVGNLAESAAQAVGADPLLSRVGAYYHDVGKLKRPYLFIENQLGMENPHEKLAPSLSTLIIISHVKYGLELAKQYQLPEPITDIIVQHHGTSLVAYFYHQAKMKCTESIIEEDFRYHGPKPKTKEAALIMIADSIEAAARSLSQPNTNRIENLVTQIINDMLKDGQLDECELSFKNINDLKKSFIKTMNGMYHTRIEYPEKIEKDISDAAKVRKLYTFAKPTNKLSQK
ncbi:MAG: HDIG domain-containing protein [Candidatus Eremiobacteraeota bacterium]|nr:HDIG domain-containing protein [Candidatus Eremiobacteraeota bacterium]